MALNFQKKGRLKIESMVRPSVNEQELALNETMCWIDSQFLAFTVRGRRNVENSSQDNLALNEIMW